jgi:ABC-type branched-subunit amino acid transport system permease subunit
MSQNTTVVVTQSTKSVGISLILTFLFGGLGMFYSTIIGAIIMIVIELIVGILTFGFGLIFTHAIAMIWGAIATNQYNKKLLHQAKQ